MLQVYEITVKPLLRTLLMQAYVRPQLESVFTGRSNTVCFSAEKCLSLVSANSHSTDNNSASPISGANFCAAVRIFVYAGIK